MSLSTKCWDCAKATGGCSWSNSFEPVKGWVAVPTKVKIHKSKNPTEEMIRDNSSYVVIDCPEFLRDAYNNGLKRYIEGEDHE